MERDPIELAEHLLQQFRGQLRNHFSCLFSWIVFLLHRVYDPCDLCHFLDPYDRLCHHHLSFQLYDHDLCPNLCDHGDDHDDPGSVPWNDYDDADCDPFHDYDLFHDCGPFRDSFLSVDPVLFAFKSKHSKVDFWLIIKYFFQGWEIPMSSN